MATLEASGEPLIPAFADLLEVYKTRELTAAEALQVCFPRQSTRRILTRPNQWQLNIKTRAFKENFLAAWNDTIRRTATGRPIDALICPPAPAVGFPHDFNIYWGYTSMFNLLDYPSIILPIPGFKINSRQDPIDSNYRPLQNPYDKPNYDLCKLAKLPYTLIQTL